MRVVLACCISLASLAGAQRSATPFDVLITNGHIIDGTGSPWYGGDVGIRNGRVVAMGHLSGASAKRRIDAKGMVVAPGFIDMLGQSELTILVNPHLPSKIFQGITTEVTGEGGSVAPLNEKIIAADAPIGMGLMYGPPRPPTKAMGRMAATTASVARMVGLPTSSTASTATSKGGLA